MCTKSVAAFQRLTFEVVCVYEREREREREREGEGEREREREREKNVLSM